MRAPTPHPALLLAAALLTASAAHAQYKRLPTVDDVLDLAQVSDAQISPDGTRVLYTRSDLKSWKDNKRVSSVWLVTSDGKEPYQFLASDKDRTPRWSPDGSRIAFLSTRDQKEGDRDAGPQLYLIRASGG